MTGKSRSAKSRRQAIGIFGTLALWAGWPARALAIATPAQTEGPFYPLPAVRYPDIDNDLVKIDGNVIAAGGEIVTLKGRVLDSAGRPVPGARVEIWQCDANGRYIHTGDRGGNERDPGFQGFGHYVTTAEGRYAFRTIKPVAYPGRAPHIHVKVVHPDFEITTQFYISGHSQNAKDRLFRRLSGPEQELVSMVFVRKTTGLETTVDIRA